MVHEKVRKNLELLQSEIATEGLPSVIFVNGFFVVYQYFLA
jgi:hypothetical protein